MFAFVLPIGVKATLELLDYVDILKSGHFILNQDTLLLSQCIIVLKSGHLSNQYTFSRSQKCGRSLYCQTLLSIIISLHRKKCNGLICRQSGHLCDQFVQRILLASKMMWVLRQQRSRDLDMWCSALSGWSFKKTPCLWNGLIFNTVVLHKWMQAMPMLAHAHSKASLHTKQECGGWSPPNYS